MKKYEIYLVNFPFSNLKETKKRPAVLVGDIKGENKIFAQISTKNKLIKDYKVELKKENIIGKINFDSFIYSDMIFTLHSSLVTEKIGEVMAEEINLEIKNKLSLIFE